MSVIIEGIKKPKTCAACGFARIQGDKNKKFYCAICGCECNLSELTPKECPLKELEESVPNPDPVKKPPLGLMPRELWEESRIREILAAMKRYEKENMPIPQEWLKELRDLTTNLVSNKY